MSPASSPEPFAVDHDTSVREALARKKVASRQKQTYRCEGAIGGDPITLHALLSVRSLSSSWSAVWMEADLIFSGTFARPYERIGTEITLNIGGDNFPGDAFSGLEPLSGWHSRHCE